MIQTAIQAEILLAVFLFIVGGGALETNYRISSAVSLALGYGMNHITPRSPGDPTEGYTSGKRHTGMLHRPKGMGMGIAVGPDPNEEWMVWRTDETRIRAVRVAIDQTFESVKEKMRSFESYAAGFDSMLKALSS